MMNTVKVMKVTPKVVASTDPTKYPVRDLPISSSIAALLLQIKVDPSDANSRRLSTLDDVWVFFHVRCNGDLESMVLPELGIGDYKPFATASDELQLLLINHPATKEVFAQHYVVQTTESNGAVMMGDNNAVRVVKKGLRTAAQWIYS